MASQVLSGANNASYTNNTGQNVRLIINYMSNVTSMTWAGVTVTASATTIGKDVPISYSSGDISLTLPQGALSYTETAIDRLGRASGSGILSWGSYAATRITTAFRFNQEVVPVSSRTSFITSNATGTLTLLPSTNTSFPIELMLANGESFSSVCGAYNAIVIKEDGT